MAARHFTVREARLLDADIEIIDEYFRRIISRQRNDDGRYADAMMLDAIIEVRGAMRITRAAPLRR